jgi:hypothetical protein
MSAQLNESQAAPLELCNQGRHRLVQMRHAKTESLVGAPRSLDSRQ